MKKFISFVLVLLLVTVSACAQTPDFLKQGINYTADYNVTLTFENPQVVKELMEEFDASTEKLSYFMDVEAFFDTLVSGSSTCNIKADMLEDYKELKMSVVSDASKHIEFNSNLNFDINSKSGMWLDVNLKNKDDFKFDIIYRTPVMDKLFYISADDFADNVDIEKIFDGVSEFLNKEYIESLNSKIADIYAKYSKIEGSGNNYVLTLDNDGFIAMVNELIALINEEIAKNNIMSVDDEPVKIPFVKQCKILGEEGIRCDVALKDGNIIMKKITADIDVDIASVYKAITGNECEEKFKRVLSFNIEATTQLYDHGTTVVEYPVITEDNSVTISDLNKSYYGEDDYSDYETSVNYPVWYIYETAPQLPVVNDEIYVPLRKTLEAAYEDSLIIEYQNGVITAQSEYFDGFDNVIVEIDKDTVIAGENVYTYGKPIVIDNTIYVSSKLFEEVFNWTISEASYDILLREYHFGFYTEEW